MEPNNGTEFLGFATSNPPTIKRPFNLATVIPNKAALKSYLKFHGLESGWDEKEIESFIDEYKLPMILMYGFDEEGEILLFVVTFDEALALIGAGRPDKSGVKGMSTVDLINFLKPFDFSSKNGEKLLQNPSFQALVEMWNGKGVW